MYNVTHLSSPRAHSRCIFITRVPQEASRMFRVIDLSPKTGYYPRINSAWKTKRCSRSVSARLNFTFATRGRECRLIGTQPSLRSALLENRISVLIQVFCSSFLADIPEIPYAASLRTGEVDARSWVFRVFCARRRTEMQNRRRSVPLPRRKKLFVPFRRHSSADLRVHGHAHTLGVT